MAKHKSKIALLPENKQIKTTRTKTRKNVFLSTKDSPLSPPPPPSKKGGGASVYALISFDQYIFGPLTFRHHENDTTGSSLNVTKKKKKKLQKVS